jgi:hypothetical protein
MLNGKTLPADQLGAFLSGMLDVVFAFSIALERSGLLARAEIVDVLREVQALIAAEGGDSTARNAVVELMLLAFDRPAAGASMRDRWQVTRAAPGAPTNRRFSLLAAAGFWKRRARRWD